MQRKRETTAQTLERLRTLVQRATVCCEMLDPAKDGDAPELRGIDVDAIDGLLSEVLEELNDSGHAVTTPGY